MEGIAGLALVHVASDEEANVRFAGRTLVERALALAAAVRLQPVLVTAEGRAPAPNARDGRGRAEACRPGDPLPEGLAADLPVVAWRCDAGFVAASLREILAEGAPRERVVRDDAGRVAIVRADAAALGGRAPADPAELAARLAGASGAPTRRRPFALDPAAAGRSMRAAETELVATLENPRDGLFDRLLNRPLSRRLTPLLLDLPLTPNQVTIVSLATGLLAAACFAAPGRWWPVAGALLVQATAVLDCVDGEIARAKVLESAWGEVLDVTSDTAIHVLAFLGIAVHVWPEFGARAAWSLGALFATGGLLSFAVVTRAERTEERWKPMHSPASRLLGGLLAKLTTRDLSVLLLAAALLGMLRPLLVGAAFGAHAFWIVALALHARLMREVASRGTRPGGPDGGQASGQARSVTR